MVLLLGRCGGLRRSGGLRRCGGLVWSVSLPLDLPSRVPSSTLGLPTVRSEGRQGWEFALRFFERIARFLWANRSFYRVTRANCSQALFNISDFEWMSEKAKSQPWLCTLQCTVILYCSVGLKLKSEFSRFVNSPRTCTRRTCWGWPGWRRGRWSR